MTGTTALEACILVVAVICASMAAFDAHVAWCDLSGVIRNGVNGKRRRTVRARLVRNLLRAIMAVLTVAGSVWLLVLPSDTNAAAMVSKHLVLFVLSGQLIVIIYDHRWRERLEKDLEREDR